MTKAFERFNEIQKMDDITKKHREWLKDYQENFYSIAEFGKHKIKWSTEKRRYLDSEFKTEINCISKNPKRVIIEFDDENSDKAKENLEKVYRKLKEKGWGFIRSTHNGKTDYLWVEFNKELKTKETKNFLKWICPEDAIIDLNFASSRKVFPVLFAIHWKHSQNREFPIEYFEGEQIDYDSLNIQETKEKNLFERKNGFVYHTFKKAANIFNKENQAEKFNKIQPLFYDKAGMWWLWNPKEFNWETVDDVDILNMISATTKEDTITSKNRNEILNALKQEGRKNIPKPIEKTWIQFKDDVYDIATGENFKATPKYFFTNPLPWKVGKNEETPTIDKLFHDWVKEEDIPKLYEIISFVPVPKYFIHAFWFLYSPPGYGKSTFTNLIVKFIGDNNYITSSIERINKNIRFETKNWYRKLLIVMSEASHVNQLKNSSTINQATGEDPIAGEIKGGGNFNFVNYGKFVYPTNKLLKVDADDGFGRRARTIDFTSRFEKERDVLNEIPNWEMENLAKKSVRIAGELWRKRQFTGDVSISERIKEHQERSKSPVERFVDRYCDTTDFEAYIPFAEFYAKLNKEEPNAGSKIEVSKELTKLQWEIKGKGYKTDQSEIDGNVKWETKKSILGLKWKDNNVDTEKIDFNEIDKGDKNG